MLAAARAVAFLGHNTAAASAAVLPVRSIAAALADVLPVRSIAAALADVLSDRSIAAAPVAELPVHNIAVALDVHTFETVVQVLHMPSEQAVSSVVWLPTVQAPHTSVVPAV